MTLPLFRFAIATALLLPGTVLPGAEMLRANAQALPESSSTGLSANELSDTPVLMGNEADTQESETIGLIEQGTWLTDQTVERLILP